MVYVLCLGIILWVECFIVCVGVIVCGVMCVILVYVCVVGRRRYISRSTC